jgi:branched-chain amino acid transport system permease protein
VSFTAAVAVAVILTIVLTGPYRTALTTSIVATLVCLSIVVLTGMLGQISLAQMTFAGAAGFVLSNLTTRANIPFPLRRCSPSPWRWPSASWSRSRPCAFAASPWAW